MSTSTAALFGIEDEFDVLSVDRQAPDQVKDLPASGQQTQPWWRKRRLACVARAIGSSGHALALGLRCGPVGVGAALHDEDRATDVARLLCGVDGGGLPHRLQSPHPARLGQHRGDRAHPRVPVSRLGAGVGDVEVLRPLHGAAEQGGTEEMAHAAAEGPYP